MASVHASSNVLRPIPRRASERPNSSTEPSTASSSPAPASNGEMLVVEGRPDTDSPSRTRSLLNLTSSALCGIYSPTTTTHSDRLETSSGLASPRSTKWIATDHKSFTDPPQYRRLSASHHHHHRHPQQQQQHQESFHCGRLAVLRSWVLRSIVLFAVGVAYGFFMLHLHDHPNLAPAEVTGLRSLNRWSDSLFWGGAGVVSGSLLPWIDTIWERRFGHGGALHDQNRPRKGTSSAVKSPDDHGDDDDDDDDDSNSGTTDHRSLTPITVPPPTSDWSLVVRSVGALVGIAFAIVRQISTLASTNLSFRVLRWLKQDLASHRWPDRD